MPASSNFPQGFKNGLILRGMPLMQTQPGQVFWVSNSTTLSPGEVNGSNGNDGTFYRPFATINFAVGACKANHGDIIMVKPNHAETIATRRPSMMNKAGIAIIGLGSGSSRPTLTFSTRDRQHPGHRREHEHPERALQGERPRRARASSRRRARPRRPISTSRAASSATAHRSTSSRSSPATRPRTRWTACASSATASRASAPRRPPRRSSSRARPTA
jgi:hypothetical protein